MSKRITVGVLEQTKQRVERAVELSSKLTGEKRYGVLEFGFDKLMKDVRDGLEAQGFDPAKVIERAIDEGFLYTGRRGENVWVRSPKTKKSRSLGRLIGPNPFVKPEDAAK